MDHMTLAPEAAFQHLLDHPVKLTVRDCERTMTVAELADMAWLERYGRGVFAAALGAIGMKVVDDGGATPEVGKTTSPALLFDPGRDEFQSIFDLTPWHGCRMDLVLRSIPGASRKLSTSTRSIGGKRCRVQSVPLTGLVGE